MPTNIPHPLPGSAAPHTRMVGAAVVRHLPAVRAPWPGIERQPHGLFLLWLAYMGLLVYGAWLLWLAGVWHRLIEVDPTRLTLVIVVLFVASSLWCGQRAWVLGQQRLRLLGFGATDDQAWAHAYQASLRIRGADASVAALVLGERAHGPHEMAWWINGIQLKLGLLGKVIGFSILAYQLGQTDSFDPSQSTQLLKSLTGGLGIALLTTVTGLCGNILLGVQLMRLDRCADALVADILSTPPDADTGH